MAVMSDVKSVCYIGVTDSLVAVMSDVTAVCCIGVMNIFSGCDD